MTNTHLRQKKNVAICGAQSGSVLMYLVAVIVVAGALSAGLVSLTTTSTFTQLSQGNSEQARYMAMAGYEYAKKRLHENAPDIDIDEIADEDEGYSLGDHGSFKLKLGEIDNDLFAGRYEIVSEGIAYKGTSRQASYKIKGKFSPGFIDVPYAEMSEKEIENFIHHSAVKVPDDQNRDDWEPDSDPDNRVPDDVKVLSSSVGGSMLFVPVPATNDYNQYIVRAVVRNSEADSEGYAVFFDTELNDENKPDPGYSFNMDPDADELSIREWDDGERADEPETEVDPEKIEDFDYEDFYYIEIEVTGNSRRAEATIYGLEEGANYTEESIRNFDNDGPWDLDSDLFLSHSYSFDFDFTSEQQIYAGFQILGDEPVYFHHLEIEIIDADTDYDKVLVSKGDIELTGSSKIYGDVRAVEGDVDLGWSTIIDGDVTLRSDKDIIAPDEDVIKGEVKRDDRSYDFCRFSLSPLVGCHDVCDFPDECDNFKTTYGNTEILLNDDNCYNKLDFTGNRTLEVSVSDQDRVMFINEFNPTDDNGHLEINRKSDDDNGRLILYVRNSFQLKGSSSINMNGDTDDLIVYYSGTFDLYMGENTKFNGAIFASNANVIMSGSSEFSGYIESKSFQGLGDIVLTGKYYSSFNDYCADGDVLYVDDDGNIQEMPFENEITLPDPNYPGLTKLIITSGVGLQTIDGAQQEFNFDAPDGIYIQSGVILEGEHNHNKINLNSSDGDIVLEEGVELSTNRNAKNETDEIYIEAAGNIDIKGVEMSAQRYINLNAGQNIYAQDANLAVTKTGGQYGNTHEIILETGSGKIYNKNILYDPDITYRCPAVGPGCVDSQ